MEIIFNLTFNFVISELETFDVPLNQIQFEKKLKEKYDGEIQ